LWVVPWSSLRKILRALVTGATGFIGSHLAGTLLAKGYSVACVVRQTSDLTELKNLNVAFVEGDITDRESLVTAVRQADIIFHLGGITKAKSESAYFKINADGSRILYEVCLEHNPQVQKIVHVSSLAAAGPADPEKPRTESDPADPLTFYGKSKWEGEKYAMEYGKKLPITIIRPPAVYGPREKDIFFYFQLIGWHIMPRLGLGNKYLSLIYVDDLVDAILLAAESPQSNGQTYYVDDGRIYTWQDLSAAIRSAMQTWTVPIVVPEFVIIVIAYLAEFLSLFSKKPALLNRQKTIELRQKAWTSSSEKIRRELGFKNKFDLERGCKETAAWYRSHRWL
jgi:dihydroflavonol-4-reductase